MVALGYQVRVRASIHLGELRVMAEVQNRVCGGVAVALNQSIGAVEVASGAEDQFAKSLTIPTTGWVNRPQALGWNAPHPVEGCVALKTVAELGQLWEEQGGTIADLPTVDFEHSMVLAVFAGEGFFREVPSIERVKVLADEVVAYVSRFSRPWSKHNAKAVVQVPRQTLPVRFVYLS